MKIEIGGGIAALDGYVQVDVLPTPANPKVFADIRALPFRNLEGIYASNVFEHIANADIVPAMKSCRKALARGGVLEIYVPDFVWSLRKFLSSRTSVERWGAALNTIFGNQENPGQFHLTGFSVLRMAKCLEMAGFRNIDAKRRRRQSRTCGWRSVGEFGSVGYVTHLPMEVWAVATP